MRQNNNIISLGEKTERYHTQYTAYLGFRIMVIKLCSVLNNRWNLLIIKRGQVTYMAYYQNWTSPLRIASQYIQIDFQLALNVRHL